MPRLYHTLMLLIAGATQKELARHVRDLKIEIQILRTKPPARVAVTTKECQERFKTGHFRGLAGQSRHPLMAGLPK